MLTATGAHPIGYVEVQRAWIGAALLDATIESMLHDIAVQMASEHPGMRYVSSRCEHTKDGAGVDHYTLYAGYAPNIANPTEPLDPRNLNSSDRAEQIGDPARDNAIGMKEQRF